MSDKILQMTAATYSEKLFPRGWSAAARCARLMSDLFDLSRHVTRHSAGFWLASSDQAILLYFSVWMNRTPRETTWRNIGSVLLSRNT